MASDMVAPPLKTGLVVSGWTLLKKLGEGTFSDVWSGKNRANQLNVSSLRYGVGIVARCGARDASFVVRGRRCPAFPAVGVAAKSDHVLLKGQTWALKLSVLFPQADGRGKVSAARLKKSRRGNKSKSDVTTDESQRLFNEYQITALRIRPIASKDVELARLFSLPPSACATGTGRGYQFLAMRNAGVDMMRLARPLNAKRYPLGAVCAVGVDMVRQSWCWWRGSGRARPSRLDRHPLPLL